MRYKNMQIERVISMANKKLKDGDISSWITVSGEHIPVKKGQTKSQAVKQNSRVGKDTNKKKGKYDKLSSIKKKGKK